MKNHEAFRQANEPRGTRGHIAQYLTKPGHRVDERTVGSWGEGAPSPLDTLQLTLAAYALVNPAGFQILVARTHEIITEIQDESRQRLTDERDATAQLEQEWHEFLHARLNGKPRSVQKKELMDVVAIALEELRRMDSEADAEKSPRITQVRKAG